MSERRRALTLVLGLLAFSVVSGRAAAAPATSECARATANLACPPVSGEEAERARLLGELDAAGRDAAARGDLDAATFAFGCLLAADPKPESAGNLAIVLRERGLLVEALTAARCAEQLAPPGPAHDRAQARLSEIARRITGADPTAPAVPPPVAAAPVVLVTPPAPPPAHPSNRVRRGWAYGALAVGAAGVISAAVLYGLARHDAAQFADEQLASGYSARARDLRSSAQTLQTFSAVAGGVGALGALAGSGVLLFW